MIKGAAESKKKNPRKPTYAALTDYKTETRNIIDWAIALDDRKVAGYTSAIFKDGYRKLENITGMHSVLILDLDNHKDEPQLTVKELKDKMEEKGIVALFMPTASHTEEVNRARIIIPTAMPFKLPTDRKVDEWKVEYGFYVQNFVNTLDIDAEKAKAIDTVNSRPSRMYYASPSDVTAIISSGTVYDNSSILEQARQDYKRLIESKAAKKELELAAKVKKSVNISENIETKMEEHIQIEQNRLSEIDSAERRDLDDDRYLTRTILSQINKNIDIFDAVKLVFPKANEEQTNDVITINFNCRIDHNKNLRGEYNCIWNMGDQKVYTPISMLTWYIKNLNRDIREYNDGLYVDSLRELPLIQWLNGMRRLENLKR